MVQQFTVQNNNDCASFIWKAEHDATPSGSTCVEIEWELRLLRMFEWCECVLVCAQCWTMELDGDDVVSQGVRENESI